jgi:hypothetical protein
MKTIKGAISFMEARVVDHVQAGSRGKMMIANGGSE